MEKVLLEEVLVKVCSWTGEDGVHLYTHNQGKAARQQAGVEQRKTAAPLLINDYPFIYCFQDTLSHDTRIPN